MNRFAFIVCILTSSCAFAGTAYFQATSGYSGEVFDDQTTFNFEFYLSDGRYGTLDNNTPFLQVGSKPPVYINQDVHGVGTGVYFDVYWAGVDPLPTDSVLVVNYKVTNPGGSHLHGMIDGSMIGNGNYTVNFESQYTQTVPSLKITTLDTTLLGDTNPNLPGLSFVGVRTEYQQTGDPFTSSDFLVKAQLRYNGTGVIHNGDQLARFTITGVFVPEPTATALAAVALAIACGRGRFRFGTRGWS